MKHNNRRSQQERSGKGKVKNTTKDRRSDKQQQGSLEIAEDFATKSENYKLAWFKPTENQKDIIDSMCCNSLTVIQAPSGCGKSTTAIWKGLQDLKDGHYNQIVFVKTPDESSDDGIGYCKGGLEDKMEPHFEAMRSIFYSFMTRNKLLMEEKHERIVFKIPNFMKGMTLDNALILIDEAQSLSPNILKCIMERAGEGSSVVVMGDKAQRYSSKKRDDGLTDFVNKITYVDENNNRVSKEPIMGYVELTAVDNMRSPLSKRIVEIYAE